MNIYAKSGHKVIAKDLENGWDFDKRKAEKYLEQDKIYTVAFTEVYSSCTDVYLVEIPAFPFNSVHFEDYFNSSFDKYTPEADLYGFKCHECGKLNVVESYLKDNLFCCYCGSLNIVNIDWDEIL